MLSPKLYQETGAIRAPAKKMYFGSVLTNLIIKPV